MLTVISLRVGSIQSFIGFRVGWFRGSCGSVAPAEGAITKRVAHSTQFGAGTLWYEPTIPATLARSDSRRGVPAPVVDAIETTIITICLAKLSSQGAWLGARRATLFASLSNPFLSQPTICGYRCWIMAYKMLRS